MDIHDLEIGDLVEWEDANRSFRKVVCRIVNIHYKESGITTDTEVTIMDIKGNAFDVYACELDIP